MACSITSCKVWYHNIMNHINIDNVWNSSSISKILNSKGGELIMNSNLILLINKILYTKIKN